MTGRESASAERDAGREALDRLRRFGGDQLVRDLSTIFVADTPGRVSAARAGVLAGDAAAVWRAAHAMKSSAGQFGATAMQQLCEEAERLAEQGELAPLADLVDRIDAAFATHRAWLERVVSTGAVHP